MKFGVGQSIRRVEDARLITGAGLYTDDYRPANMVHGIVVRSPHAHARFTIGDLSTVRAMPGVLLILTHADIRHLGGIPCVGTTRNADGSPMATPPYPVLCQDTARHVGDAVAFVVAETEDQARAAAEAVEIDWEPLDATVGIAGAEAEGSPLVWPEMAGNLAFDTEVGSSREAADKAFAKAHRVISLTLVNNRLVTNYLEPRACVAEYDAGSERWTIMLGSQGSHGIRDSLAKNILKIAPERIRVVTPDVGGGFGTKIFMYREYPLCAVAAERLKRPVRWAADRTEHFTGDAQGRTTSRPPTWRSASAASSSACAST